MSIRNKLAASIVIASTVLPGMPVRAQTPDPTPTTTAPAANSDFTDRQYAKFAPYLNAAQEACGANDDQARAALLKVFKQGWLYAGRIADEGDKNNNNTVIPGQYVALFYAQNSDTQKPSTVWKKSDWVIANSETLAHQATDARASLAVSPEDCAFLNIRAEGFSNAAGSLQAHLATYQALTQFATKPPQPTPPAPH